MLLMLCLPLIGRAQIGEYRNVFSVGASGGYMLSSVGFVPKVTQGQHGGLVGGLIVRYTSEKYFKTICSIQGEINYAQAGWRENIVDMQKQPVMHSDTEEAERYERTLNYIQVPILAHLAWGKEERGMQFFIELGPQFGYSISESTSTNFTIPSDYNYNDRANHTVAQDTMAVENKFDYGIAVGAGMEYGVPHLGRFALSARYYYGLGNIYGSSKRDYFAKSNIGQIVVKLSYLLRL